MRALGAVGARGRCGVWSAPTGHRIPARSETPGMAHNRCVLMERRIPPGALTCFAVAECWGWRLGLVGGGGSAGSVLRSQGTLGPVGLSRCRARGIRMSTFLCSLRPGTAAASWIGCSMRESDSRRFGMRHRFSKEDLQDLGPIAQGTGKARRSRGGAPRGGPAFAGNVSIGRFRAARERGAGCSRSYALSGPPRYRPASATGGTEPKVG
ncbi:MAG: hypothetical protein RJB04_1474 [Verrucomicrobiota bacterium]